MPMAKLWFGDKHYQRSACNRGRQTLQTNWTASTWWTSKYTQEYTIANLESSINTLHACQTLCMAFTVTIAFCPIVLNKIPS